jgi:L-alanine-DL-glutamate epimerase-like enolase superfamily enzyme
MALYDAVADLPVRIDEVGLTRRERDTSSGFTRVTTEIAVRGEGETGRGEDVTYDAAPHDALADSQPFDLTGEYTVDAFSAALDDVDLFPDVDPDQAAARNYRRWGFESAALDLALKQAGESLASALGRSYDSVNFVVSTRLGDPPTTDRVETLLDVHPDLAFKLDPTSDWDADLVEDLASTATVRILDLKGQYEGTDVDQAADLDLYRLVADAFPEVVIEDPALTAETDAFVDETADRISWDKPITGVDSVESLPFEPTWLNVKPSRFGSVESLLDTIEFARVRDVRLYGGGQFELGVGRQHLHALASLFYPDGPNDVAPGGYNDPDPSDDLPAPPLSPPDDPRGLEW